MVKLTKKQCWDKSPKYMQDAMRETIKLVWLPKSKGIVDVPECRLCVAIDKKSVTCKCCMIGMFTSENGCINTPFYDWIHASTSNNPKLKQHNAKRMVRFLKGFLPKDEQ